jgi:hypothetical protein
LTGDLRWPAPCYVRTARRNRSARQRSLLDDGWSSAPWGDAERICVDPVVEGEEAEAIRAYCDAVEARHGADTVAADADAAQWLALAREHADQAQQLPCMPSDPEMTHERLKPCLGGWSPYGPHRW